MERAAFLSALVLALGPGAARAACTLDLNIVPELSMLEIGGVLSKVIDIELQGEPPRVDGTIVVSTEGPCPATADDWNGVDDVLISAKNLTLVPPNVELKAAVVKILLTDGSLAFGATPATHRAAEGIRIMPDVTITSGIAHIGHEAFDLGGSHARADANGTFVEDASGNGGVELQLSRVAASFSVETEKIKDSSVAITGSLVARQPVCDPPCGRHGTCVIGRPFEPPVCACTKCNFVGPTCEQYAPLRLSTAEPAHAEYGKELRVTIVGRKLGTLASMPPPLPAEGGPPFHVRTTDGSNCTGLVVLNETAVACTLPPQLPGTEIRFDVERGCATAPFSPGAVVQVRGCGRPEDLVCGLNQVASEDGCTCGCAAGWQGKLCTACATDRACAALLPDSAPASAGGAGGGSEGGGAGDASEPLQCTVDDFAFHAGTVSKALACALQQLPDGIEPLVISLVCGRSPGEREGTCRLLVAPEDDEDRANIGAEGGPLECTAVGCTFDESEAHGKCRDVTCDLGMYDGAIRAVMPDLVIGGTVELTCEEKEEDATHAICFVDLDILPVDLMAECRTSDCVNTAQMSAEHAAGMRVGVVIAALCGVCAAMLLLGAAAFVFVRYTRMSAADEYSMASATAFARESASHTLLPDDLNSMPRVGTLAFRDVRVSVASGRQIVCGASGAARAGEVYGVIGASGSGKTTLLDAIAGVMAPGASRTGDVLVDGHAIPKAGVRLPALVGYVRQEDNLSMTLTPRECVSFAAALTLPLEASAATRLGVVDATLSSLGLAHIANTRLGGSAAALQRVSGGERRRVAIAMSMVSSPRVLLLDEPTSGLDSSSAHRLVSTLRQLAAQDRVVMLSIHQPAQRTFELLHSALLMHAGSPVCVGQIAELRALCASAAVPCPAGYNLADHLLDVTADDGAVARLRAACAAPLSPGSQPALPPHVAEPPWQAVERTRGWRGSALQLGAELRALYWRIGINVLRHPALLRLHMLVVISLGVAVGLVFHGVGNNLASFQNRSGACFFVLALFGFSGLSAMEVFISEQELMLRELQAGYYRLSAFFVAKISVDALLLRALPALLFSMLFYPMMGLRPEMARFGTFVGTCVLVNMASGLLCAAISVLFDSLGAANLAATILMLMLLLMNGALVNLREVGATLQTLQSLSFFRYGFEALLTNELEKTVVMVDAPGIVPIPVKSHVFLEVLGMDAAHIPRDTRVLLLFCVAHATLAAALLYAKASTWRPRWLYQSWLPAAWRRTAPAKPAVHTNGGGGAHEPEAGTPPPPAGRPAGRAAKSGAANGDGEGSASELL